MALAASHHLRRQQSVWLSAAGWGQGVRNGTSPYRGRVGCLNQEHRRGYYCRPSCLDWGSSWPLCVKSGCPGPLLAQRFLSRAVVESRQIRSHRCGMTANTFSKRSARFARVQPFRPWNVDSQGKFGLGGRGGKEERHRRMTGHNR